MKKLFYPVFIVLITFFTLTGCDRQKAAVDSSDFAGTWNGCGNALGKDSRYRAENLSLSIGDDGSFHLSDIEQSTVLLSGTFSLIDKDALTVVQSADSLDRLPKGWEDFSPKDRLHYRMPDRHHLILTYDSVSYYFEQEEVILDQMEKGSVSPLLDMAETDIWYSSTGQSADDPTYELALYDRYAELYALPADNSKKGTFLTNFLYYSNEGETFTFYTCRDEKTPLPDVFSSLPDGISKVSMQISPSDDALTVTYEGRSLSFYNNVIYGQGTSSTAYFLNDNSFSWKFDGRNHFCYFATDPTSGALYLYVQELDENQEKTDAICGTITIDEGSKELIFSLNKKESKKTAGKHSPLFRFFRALEKPSGELRIPFTLKDSRLKLKTKKLLGQNYTFDLISYQPKAN
ncbi:MAG: hypothetical protein Q4D60_05960 [Eubacteriales bacterium]|nr:hypothetical protein [Eubacteriales bacterium]